MTKTKKTNWDFKLGKKYLIKLELFQPTHREENKSHQPTNFANSTLQRAVLLGSSVPVLESQSNEMKIKVSWSASVSLDILSSLGTTWPKIRILTFMLLTEIISMSLLTLKYSTRSLQVTLDPLISFSTKFSGASSNGIKFRSSFLNSSSISSKIQSISRKRWLVFNLVSPKGTLIAHNPSKSTVSQLRAAFLRYLKAYIHNTALVNSNYS